MPSGFCGAFRDFDGLPLSPHEQRDADEFLHELLQRIEEGLGEAHPLLDALFGGALAQQVLWTDPADGATPRKSGHLEPFRVLQLDTAGCATLEEALEGYVAGELISGYDVGAADGARVEARKRCCLGRLPHTLVVQMKRFEFDYDTMVKRKVFDHCAVPERLDVAPYTDADATGAAAAPASADADAPAPATAAAAAGDGAPPSSAPPSTRYALVGVTIHIGDADYGHYYSYIRERPGGGRAALSGGGGGGRWLEFNDSVVREISAAELAAIGVGADAAALAADVAAGGGTPSAATPYILFYQQTDAAAGDEGGAADERAPPVLRAPSLAVAGDGGAGGGDGREGCRAEAAADAAAEAAAGHRDAEAAEGIGGAWAVRAVLEGNDVAARRAQVFRGAHLAFVERLVSEQSEAWRGGEISPADAAHALVHGVEFFATTLCHAHADVAARPLQALTQSLYALCEECHVGCRHLLAHLADEPNAAPLLRAPLLEGGPSPQTAQYAGLLLHAISQGAAAAAAAPDAAQAMDGVLNVIGLLLALLPDAAALVREGGAPPGGCRDYTALMAAIDAEPLLAPALEAVASPSARRLLDLFLPPAADEYGGGGEEDAEEAEARGDAAGGGGDGHWRGGLGLGGGPPSDHGEGAKNHLNGYGGGALRGVDAVGGGSSWREEEEEGEEAARE